MPSRASVRSEGTRQASYSVMGRSRCDASEPSAKAPDWISRAASMMGASSTLSSRSSCAHDRGVAMRRDAIVDLDKRRVWHPYTPMQRYIDATEPLVIERAEGARLFDVDGKSYI